ncbi:MAG TPA: aspartate--tRNA(Asn) ligase [Candidatus Pacearchaeota archaeon]|nr:asparagine--tRNA ligase [archaeon BMS3Abin17]HDK42107.1 aspartate--tRNA(Asn) ligase [Candidatus Pacearchaeota archaeon]HDZ60641.1 aspartate--tRNA(Asn) ligase [Candidatus Pacearchaeota archaeon]
MENRILVKDAFKKKGKVDVAGWVHNTRDLNKIKFILLRDVSGIIQITGVKGKTPDKVFKDMSGITRESVIYVSGTIKDSKQAPGGKEINPDKIEIISKAEDLPIDVSDYSKTELPKRLDYRFLDLHRQKTQAIFKIQSEICNSFREFFYKKSFIEMQPPCIISSASEGGTDLFPVKYFEKDAYLAQSPQLYKQMVACSMGNTFMITPIWRAEKHNTTRHINEIRQMDIEIAFANQEIAMKEHEDVVKYIVGQVIKKCKDELKLLKVDLKIPKVKYLSYDETVKSLKMKYGEDLSPEDERKLSNKYPDTIVFVHSWPTKLKPFYIMPKGAKADAKLSEGFDAIYGGVEICSGGQRIHLPDLLEKMLKSKGLNPKNFKEYVDSFRYGAPHHAGWSLGLERLTEIICGLDNIREATMFPRDRDRLSP